MPSFLKKKLLRLNGHKIGENVKIGFCYLDIQEISLSDNVIISDFNMFKNIEKLEIKESSTIGRFNLFTCSNYYKNKISKNPGIIRIGNNTAITMRHYFDVQEKIEIGDFSLVAGIKTIFFTHQKGISMLNEAKPITIGSHVYMGAACRVMPGCIIEDNIIVGGGNILSGHMSESFSLYTTQRVSKVKSLPENSPFFSSNESTKKN